MDDIRGEPWFFVGSFAFVAFVGLVTLGLNGDVNPWGRVASALGAVAVAVAYGLWCKPYVAEARAHRRKIRAAKARLALERLEREAKWQDGEPRPPSHRRA